MNGLLHFQYFSNYNKRLNDQVYLAASQLSPEELTQDQGAFFNSILGTLNHILVGDLVWLNRFMFAIDDPKRVNSLKKLGTFPTPTQLNQIVYDNFSELHSARAELDNIIHHWLYDDMTEATLASTIQYHNMKKEPACRNLAELISHLFNHQTHHRGQVTTLLSQLGLDVGTTDFLLDIPSEAEPVNINDLGRQAASETLK